MLVDKTAFTGSTEVGRRIMQLASGNVKPVTLELGGKSANIVLDDADLDQAAAAVLWGTFLHSGQGCVSKRGAAAGDLFSGTCTTKFVAAAAPGKIVLGDQLDMGTDLGPLVSRSQVETVERYVALGRERGRRADHRGRQAEGLPDGLDSTPSSSRRSSPTCPTRPRSPRRRSSARCLRDPVRVPTTRPSPSPTTRSTGSAAVWSRTAPPCVQRRPSIHAGSMSRRRVLALPRSPTSVPAVVRARVGERAWPGSVRAARSVATSGADLGREWGHHGLEGVHRDQVAQLDVTTSSELFDLTGKVAVVTGAVAGSAARSSLGLAAAGADVVIASRKLDSCEAARPRS